MKKELTRQSKVAGLQALRQTKSTEDALNNTVSKILRSIFGILEKFVNMFAFAFKGQLKGFETLNDTLVDNENAIRQVDLNIESSRRDLDIREAEINPEDPTAQEQLAEIKKERAYLDTIANMSKQYTDLQKEQKKELETNGKITDKYMSMNQKSNSLAMALMKSSVGKGVEFQTPSINKRKAVLGLGGGYGVNQREASLTKEQYAAATKTSGFLGLGPMPSVKLNNAKPVGFAKGGIVPGSSFTGDKVLAGLNSGETIIPRGTKLGSQINDNRVINIYVNQNDKRQIEQIVLNALYTDKMLK